AGRSSSTRNRTGVPMPASDMTADHDGCRVLTSAASHSSSPSWPVNSKAAGTRRKRTQYPHVLHSFCNRPTWAIYARPFWPEFCGRRPADAQFWAKAGARATNPRPSAGWFAWLADDAVRSFSFRSPAGAYTARKERRRRGGAYWVAYRTAAGRQHKVYLGKGEELTPERLAEVTAKLAGRISPAVPDASPGRMDHGAGGLLLATKLFVPQPR